MHSPIGAAEARSDEYSKAMDDTMGSNATIKGKRLVYNHEEGMNYDLITDDIIVGSCLQVPEDADRCDTVPEPGTVLVGRSAKCMQRSQTPSAG